MRFPAAAALLVAGLVRLGVSADPRPFRFAILGDRTGGARAGVYEQAWREIAAADPVLVIATGDLIEGLSDATAPAQWLEMERLLRPHKRYPFHAVPGNHDIWSPASERLFQKHTGRPPHYSFDYGNAHFTVLDNSRSEELPVAELSFLEDDLKAHREQPVKFVFSHRPSWVVNVALRNPEFPLHRLARRYNVQYVIAGHVHQLLHLELEGVSYLSMPSTGGRLRASAEYRDGWFFGYALVEVDGTRVDFRFQELRPPHGQGRTTPLASWGMLGLAEGRGRQTPR